MGAGFVSVTRNIRRKPIRILYAFSFLEFLHHIVHSFLGWEVACFLEGFLNFRLVF